MGKMQVEVIHQEAYEPEQDEEKEYEEKGFPAISLRYAIEGDAHTLKFRFSNPRLAVGLPPLPPFGRMVWVGS